jgi:maltose O-acetyltransferase
MSDTSLPAQPVPPQASAIAKLRQLVLEDTAGLHPGLHVVVALARLLPLSYGNALRAALLRQVGFRIGPGTLIRGMPRINGGKRYYVNLCIGAGCYIDVDCTLDLEEQITLGDRVTLGHQVMILTSSHEIGPRERRAGTVMRAPVTIGAGAWLGPRCIILPGVTIGEGAVVAAGALVNKSVLPHNRVAGAPAKVVEEFEAAAA